LRLSLGTGNVFATIVSVNAENNLGIGEDLLGFLDVGGKGLILLTKMREQMDEVNLLPEISAKAKFLDFAVRELIFVDGDSKAEGRAGFYGMHKVQDFGRKLVGWELGFLGLADKIIEADFLQIGVSVSHGGVSGGVGG